MGSCLKYSAKEQTIDDDYLSQRGQLPQMSFIEVVRLKPGEKLPPPPHLQPQILNRTSNMLLVEEFKELPLERVASVTNLSQSIDIEPKNRTVITCLNSNIMRSISHQRLYDYACFASANDGYWFRVYQDALSQSDLDKRRASPDEMVAKLASTELSREELYSSAEKLVSLEILLHHEMQETLGVVQDYRFLDNLSTLELLIRPFNTKKGRDLCLWIEAGVLNSCSLAHARLDENVMMCELSICHVGARPGTFLMNKVRFHPSEKSLYYPRMFQTPIFRMSKSRFNESQNIRVLPPQVVRAEIDTSWIRKTQLQAAAERRTPLRMNTSASCRDDTIMQILNMSENRPNERRRPIVYAQLMNHTNLDENLDFFSHFATSLHNS
jgi:hypothetical protein